MLSTALSMEEKGKSYYEKAIETCRTELGKNIFTILRDDELVHIERIQNIYSKLQGGLEWDDQWKQMEPGHDDLIVVFRQMAHQNGPKVQAEAQDIKALQIGIDFEAAAVNFYKDHQEQATDPIEKEFIHCMVLEEKDHHSALVDMQYYLSNPDSYFEEMDKSGLDGA